MRYLQDYPYTAEGDVCKKTTCDVVEGTMVDKWVDVDHDSEQVGTRTSLRLPRTIHRRFRLGGTHDSPYRTAVLSW